jgi:hypothetical protein
MPMMAAAPLKVAGMHRREFERIAPSSSLSQLV